MRRCVPATVLLACSACMVGPDYSRPAVETPATFRYSEKEAAETADTEWWKLFDDPVLDQLIADALANNRTVQIAAANVEVAAGVLTTTRSPLFPQLGYGASAARRRISENIPISSGRVGGGAHTNLEAFGNASWEIDLWGRIQRLTEAAQANLFATEEARRGVILSLVAQVATSYIDLLGLDEQLEVSKRTLAAYAEGLRLFELQFRHGVVSQLTVAQARSQYETAAASIPSIERQIAVLENVISTLLGRNPGPIPRGRRLNSLTMPPIPAGLPSQLLERRPDIRQAEDALISANAQIGAAKALYYPTISLTGLFGFASEDLSKLFNGASRTWSYAGSATGPIFTGGGISGQVESAEAAQRGALAAYKLTIESAFADTESALIVHRKVKEQLESEVSRVDAFREFEHLAQLQYTGGYASYLTVIFAQTQLFPAEISSVQTRTASYISVVDVYRAMAGGWVHEADKLTAGTPPAGETH